jgi:predicted ATPase/class 3 adenylate cyclase
MAQLPTGTVTFLFTDIEGSTRLQQRVGADYTAVRDQHHQLLRAAFLAHHGVEVDTQGDAFFLAFPTAPDALAAACDATRALATRAWPANGVVRVRMGLHTGAPLLTPSGYVGLDVVRAARIAAAGHGGQILLSEATRALIEDALPDGVSVRDLGVYRLKDLLRPERLTQVVLSGLPADFPPLKTLDAHPHNLPVEATPLLGREEPVAALSSLLRREDVRLVTLTGPGGIGKTRLSVQVAADVVEAFADGVWFVSLSRLTDPELVLPTIAQMLRLREQSGTPIAETLREYLRAKRLLLVLDNFEQIVGASSDVGALLDGSPGLCVLVTSRAPLHLRGEREYALAPLSLPPAPERLAPERLAQYAAVTLFIERAQAARADFAVTAANAPVIAEICARLDGLPLAIELAAARVKVLPPEALSARLSAQLTLLTGGARDADERQQTMRATITWSEGLLTPAERTLLRRLAVFVGGGTLEAVEVVCAAQAGVAPLGMEMLDGLSALVDHSLVQQREEGGEPRFTMLHVVREYALEQLEASGEAEALRRAHLAYLVALVEPVNFREVRGLQGTYWLARLDREQDNIRAALSWAASGGEVQLGLRLAVAASGYWGIRSYHREGRAWLDLLLAARPQEQSVDATLVWALEFAGSWAANLGDLERGVTLMEQALAGARTIGDASAVAVALQLLGGHMLNMGETARGVALSDESLVEARNLKDDVDVMLNTFAQAAEGLALVPGEEGRAVALAAETVEVAQRAGKPYYEVYARRVLAFGALLSGDLLQAKEQALWALRVARDQDLTDDMLFAVESVGLVAGRTDHSVKSARLLGAVATLRESIGLAADSLWRHAADVMVASARNALGEGRWAAAFAAGRALSLEEAVAEALDERDGEGEREQR